MLFRTLFAIIFIHILFYHLVFMVAFIFSSILYAQEPNGDVFTNNKKTVDIEDKDDSSNINYEDEDTEEGESSTAYPIRIQNGANGSTCQKTLCICVGKLWRDFILEIILVWIIVSKKAKIISKYRSWSNRLCSEMANENVGKILISHMKINIEMPTNRL